MGIEVTIEVFVQKEHVEKYKTAIQDVIHDDPEIHEQEQGVCFSYGYVNYNRMDDAIKAMQIEKVPCTFYVANSSDPSIEDFTSEVKEVNGEWISTDITKSGQRVKDALLAILEKIESGESLEQIQTHIKKEIETIT